MDIPVYETVSAVMSPDPNIRTTAETRLRELEKLPNYIVGLAQLSVTPEYPLPQCQAAAVLLRKHVDTHWNANAEKFDGHETTPEAKAAVRQLCFSGLSDSRSKIRVSSAAVVSKIAHSDWPEAWPDLFDGLMNLLANGTTFQVHGAMRVLTEFMREDITGEQLPQVGPALFPQLLRILCAEEAYSKRTRARAITIFKNGVEMLFMLKEEHPQAAETFLAPLIPTWMETFVRLLKVKTTGDVEDVAGGYAIKLEIIKTVNQIISGFPKQITPYLIAIIEPIWADLTNLLEQFLLEFIHNGDSEFPSVQDSDGDVLSLESLLFAMFDFLAYIARRKSCKSLFTTARSENGQNMLNELIWIMISYMQITEEQMETWMEDANQFIADEEEDTFTFNVRIAAQDLLMTLLEKFTNETIAAVESATHRHLEAANQARLNGDTNWWKLQEACLLAIGQTSGELIEALQESSSAVKFDLAGLFNHVVLNAMQESEHPFLQGRAFVLASQFAQALPGYLGSQYLNAAVNAVQAGQATPVRVSALRALNNFCQYLDQQLVVPLQGRIIQGVCSLVAGSTEETLILVLETLMAAVKVNADVAAQYEEALSLLVLDVWRRFPADHLIGGLVDDLFETLSANPAIFPALQGRALPIFKDVIAAEDSDPAVVGSAIDLIGSLIKFSSSPLPSEYVQQLFPPLMHVLMDTEDREILQSGQACLKYFVQKDIQHITHWCDATHRSGLEYVMQFIAKLLHPAQPEHGALFVGDLINKLLQKGGSDLLPVLPDLLTAVTQRLENAQTAMFIQSLVIVFAQLMQTQADTVIDFLDKLQVNGKSGLQILITAWCENYESFHGYYSLKLSAIALAKMFARADARLNGINVRGDLVVHSAGRIMTRSQTLKNPVQYSAEIFPVKVIKLLISEYQNSLETEGEGPGGKDEGCDDSGDEDGEWEDVDEPSPFAPAEDYAYLSELVGEGVAEFAEESGENDPDLKDDPIFNTNIKDYLSEFFHACASQNLNNFAQIYEGHLKPSEREILSKILGNA